MITLSPESNAAIAIVSRLCEAHALQQETNISEILKISGANESMTWKVLADLVRAEIVIEGFDHGGYLITREPASITVLDVILPFEPALQENSRLISKAIKPAILEHFRLINFAACATACPTSKGEPESGDCPRSQLGIEKQEHA